MKKAILLLLVAVPFLFCDEKKSPNSAPEEEDSLYTITDRTGKVWDVTHAKINYQMQIKNFRYGLGPNAIRPINLPQMLSPEDSDYPNASATMRVIGVRINNDSRAYPLSVLASHEVVNDVIADTPVAVIY